MKDANGLNVGGCVESGEKGLDFEGRADRIYQLLVECEKKASRMKLKFNPEQCMNVSAN